MKFLVQHGFDFNVLFSQGIVDAKPILDALFASNVPICGHNCFLDILFLFNSFVEPLPEEVATFKSRFQLLFNDVFDTKLICSKSEYLRNVFDNTWLDKVLWPPTIIIAIAIIKCTM